MSCRRLVCDLLKTFVGWLTEECRHWNCQLAVNWADFTPLLTSRSKPDVVWIERWICNSFGPPKQLCIVPSTLQELRHIPGAHKGVCSSSFSCFFCCRVTFWPTWLNLCRWYWKWQCIQSLISQQGPPHSPPGLIGYLQLYQHWPSGLTLEIHHPIQLHSYKCMFLHTIYGQWTCCAWWFLNNEVQIHFQEPSPSLFHCGWMGCQPPPKLLKPNTILCLSIFICFISALASVPIKFTLETLYTAKQSLKHTVLCQDKTHTCAQCVYSQREENEW